MDDPHTKPKPIPFEPQYYYSREHRLQRASPTVRALNDKTVKLPNVFNTLTGTRSNRFLLITIVVLCVFISVMNRMIHSVGSYQLGAFSITVTGRFTKDGTTHLEINTVVRNAEASSEIINCAVAPVGYEGEPFKEQFLFSTEEKEEQFSLDVPFKAPQLYVVFQNESDAFVSLKVNCH
ncbi:MAG: hypothetical protein LBQ77_07445 [Treponema sp.]|jgi:hypothetical protein|nr:hypothetical protein [Treponema sp.]